MLLGGDFSSVTRQLVIAPPSLTLVGQQDTYCNPKMPEGVVGCPSLCPLTMLLMAKGWDGAPYVPGCAGLGWGSLWSQCWLEPCVDLFSFREMCKSWLQN